MEALSGPDVRDALERRVLILAPTGRDAPLAAAVLSDVRIAFEICEDLETTCRELAAGAGALLVAEEGIDHRGASALIAALAGQMPWSDLPVVLLTYPGADSPIVRQATLALGNVILLERPVRVSALVSTMRTAIRARLRQYQIRDHLFERDRAAAALREADRRKDEFVAVLAHELRNPLAPIRNSLHILKLSEDNGAGTGRIREMMERQVNHMVRLVDDLLEVSRITSGKIELRKERVRLDAVVRSAIETSLPLINVSRHKLSTELPEEPLTLEGDPVRLAQVLANLLNNAAKYSDDEGQIWLTARRLGNEVWISIRDTGLGIAAEVLPNVFDLFIQGDQSSSRAQSGLGIGLTLVKSLVEMHGGTVQAKSGGLGKGSEFVVRLPLAMPETSPALDSPDDEPVLALAGCRVLVVDDNHDAADSLSLLLRLLGAIVEVAYDGPKAIASARADPPAVIFLDIGMTGMDGYEVARLIRGDPELAEVTLIALTGWGQEDDHRRSREAGFDHHLIKPADMSAIESLLVALKPAPAGRTPSAHGG